MDLAGELFANQIEACVIANQDSEVAVALNRFARSHQLLWVVELYGLRELDDPAAGITKLPPPLK
jgi:hypothetical protein